MNEGWYMGYTRDKTKDEVRSGMAFRTMDDVTGIRFRGNRRRKSGIKSRGMEERDSGCRIVAAVFDAD